MSQHFLYSMSEFMPLVRQLLPDHPGFSLTEIGSELGTMTREMLALVEQGRMAEYVIIEPYPSAPLLAMAQKGAFRLVAALSVEALGREPVTDVYLVDGDHNYHTVSQETRLILDAATREGKYPLVLYHDVSWPCGDRDAYYAPEVIPPSERKPHTHHLGPVPGGGPVSATGWRSTGTMAFANDAGGPGNGVRRAIEDVIADRSGWEFMVVPCVFGLGILLSKDHPEYSRLKQVLAPYVDNFLIDRLERNRVQLMVELQILEDLRDEGRSAAAEQLIPTSMPPGVPFQDLRVCLDERGGGSGPEESVLGFRERMAEVWACLARAGEIEGSLPLEAFLRLRGQGSGERAYVEMAAFVRDPATCFRLEKEVLSSLLLPLPRPPSPYGSTSFLGRERLLLGIPSLSKGRREEARAACALLQGLSPDHRVNNPIPPSTVRHLPATLFRFIAWIVEESARMGLAQLTIIPDSLELLPSLLRQQSEAAGLSIALVPPSWQERDLFLAGITDLTENGVGRLGDPLLAGGAAGAAAILGLELKDLPDSWRQRFSSPDARARRLAILEAVIASDLRPRIEAASAAARERLLGALPGGALVGFSWHGMDVDAWNRILRGAGRSERIQGLFLDPADPDLGQTGLWDRFDPESALLASLWRTPGREETPSGRSRLRTGLEALHLRWVAP